MKFTTLFKSAAALLMGAVLFSCTPNEDGDGTGNENGSGKEELNENIEFTLELVAEDLDTDSAKIKVSHNGEKTDTWYGFVTTETDIDDAILDEVESLIQEDGTIASTKLKKSTSTKVTLRELEPDTEYTYVVFGLSAKGEVYGSPESLEFTTKSEFTGLTETQDWVLNYGGRDDEGKEHFTVECAESSIYFFDYVDEYYITDPESGKSFLYEYILATTEELLVAFEDATVSQLLEAGYLQQGPGELASPQRLATGSYYLYAVGFNEDGTPTGTYSTKKFEVEEEEATAEFLQWTGTYTVEDANGAYFDIDIIPADNNYMYAVVGWETGEYFNRDEDKDGEPDGIDMDTIFDDPSTEEIEYRPIFPIFFNNGDIEFCEYGLVQVQMTETEAADFGLYGWGTYEGEQTLLYTGGAVLGTGKTSDNGQTGTITGGSVKTESGVAIAIESMSYAAMSKEHYWWFNEPIKFPITLTKKVEDVSQQSMIPVSKNFRKSINSEKKFINVSGNKQIRKAL